MPTLALLAVLLVPTAGLPDDPPAAAQPPQVVTLKHVAATDAVQAVTKFLDARQLRAFVISDPETNTISVTADAAVRKQVLVILAKIDTPPQQVVVQAMVMQVRAGFLEDIGLTDDPKATNLLTLTPRELNVLNMQIRQAKARGDVMNILSRPQIQVADGQTGFIQTGQQYPYMAVSQPDGKGGTKQTIEYYPIGVSMKLTTHIKPDGKVLMRVEPQVSSVAPTTIDLGNGVKAPAFNVQTTQATVLAADGQTVVLHGLMVAGAAPSPDDGPFTAMMQRATATRDEVLIVLTPHLVRPAKAAPPAEGSTRE